MCSRYCCCTVNASLFVLDLNEIRYECAAFEYSRHRGWIRAEYGFPLAVVEDEIGGDSDIV